MLRASFCATAVLAAAVLAGACGGEQSTGAGDRESGFTPEASTTMDIAEPPLSKAQFVRRVNAICREAWDTVLGNWKRYTNPRLPGRDRPFDEAVRLSLLAGIDFYIFDNIRILGSPAGQQRAIERIIGPFQAAVELGWDERWRAESIDDIVAQFETYNERAKRYGLNDCLVDEAHLQPIAS